MYECKIAEKLVELRAAKGVTQEDVALNLSVSNKTVSKWENGASYPDLVMLIKLAKYYCVSTDVLLGIAQNEKKSTEKAIKEEFEGLCRRDVVLKAFEIVRSIIPSGFESISICSDDINDKIEVLPERTEKMYRDCISTHEFYDFVVNSDDVNMAVMLLRNKSDFEWLKNPDKQVKIAGLFDFLSDTDALSVCRFIHSTECSETFTADYIAINTGIAEEKVKKILDASIELGLCVKVTAHLMSGETEIYESFGEGNILSLITLAYEHMCGRKCYNYNFNGRCKMIGGK